MQAMKPTIQSVAVYIRVSTQEQAREGYSIQEQIERLKSYCKALNWNIHKIYTDPGYSGSNTNRPALNAMLEDIQAGKIDKVLVYKLDRLSRSQKDTLTLIEDKFLAAGVDFVSMSENFDTSSPFGRAMIGILAVFAQLEREQIRERMQMGANARAKEGLYHGSANVPVGYRYIDGMLVVDTSEAEQIRRIFAEYVSGKPKLQIAKDLNADGLLHSYGQWSIQRVTAVLTNELYIGKLLHRGEYVQGKHEAIITDKLFHDAQNRLIRDSGRHKRHTAREGRAQSVFGGMIYCKRCGRKYFQTTRASGTKVYECVTRRNGKAFGYAEKCDNKIYPVAEFDTLIINEIKQFQLNEETVRQNSTGRTEKPDRKRDLNAEIARIDAQTTRLMDLYSVSGIDLNAVSERLNALHAKREQLEDELKKAETEQHEKPSKEDMVTLAGIVDSVTATGDLAKIRHLLQIMIDHITIDGDDITVTWNID